MEHIPVTALFLCKEILDAGKYKMKETILDNASLLLHLNIRNSKIEILRRGKMKLTRAY